MITERLKGTFAGQQFMYRTELFGKTYFWMRDVEGTLYLVKDKDGQPDFS